jgi:ABC-2 type transport system ATP-binding protein
VSASDTAVADVATASDVAVADVATAGDTVTLETTAPSGDATTSPAPPTKRAPRTPRSKTAPKAAPKPKPAPATPEEEPEVTSAAPAETSVDAAALETATEASATTTDAAVTGAPAAEPAVVETPPAVVEDVEVDVELEPTESPSPRETEVVLRISGLVKRFGDTTAVAGIDLEIEAGSMFGIVGPNGAGKTTTLSMVTGLLRPDAGTVTVHGADVWTNSVVAKRTMGVLPDRLRLFDRLTGSQLLYYSGILHGLDKAVVRSRSADLAAAFGLEDSLDRLVTDYSAGMTKKIALAAAMIHSPRLLVLDEPFESVDPVSSANVIEILQKYVAAGGTVVMSSHTMGLIERICDSVAVVVNGAVLATGTMAEVRRGKSLEDRFVELAGGRKAAEGMEWLHKFSD